MILSTNGGNNEKLSLVKKYFTYNIADEIIAKISEPEQQLNSDESSYLVGL